MRSVIFAGLGAVLAFLAIPFLKNGGVPPVGFAAMLGAPGPYDTLSRSPGLAMDLAFSADGTRVIARQENGDIVAWGLTTRAPHLLGRTEGPFAYCAAEELMVTGDATGVSLTSLNNGRESRRFGAAGADFAAMSVDCSVLALASGDESRLRIWSLTPRLRFSAPTTRRPVRNGIAVSADGVRLAAATGVYSDAGGHDAGLETFILPPWGPATAGPTAADDLIAGMWRTSFSADGALLFAGSQIDGKAGLRAFSMADGAGYWGYDGFEAQWVRGLAVSPNDDLLATGDEKGLLRLWRASSGELLYEGQAGVAVQSLAFSGDGSRLAVGLWDATIGIFDVAAVLERG